MAASDPEVWSDQFVAAAGAAAALAGLVFVAVSIDISRILELAGVPERGLQTVLLLLGAAVVSSPGPSPCCPAAVPTWSAASACRHGPAARRPGWVAGIGGALVGAVVNAWVLVVEILR